MPVILPLASYALSMVLVSGIVVQRKGILAYTMPMIGEESVVQLRSERAKCFARMTDRFRSQMLSELLLFLAFCFVLKLLPFPF